MTETDKISTTILQQQFADALDVEQAAKRFDTAFEEQRARFARHISNLDDERDRNWLRPHVLGSIFEKYINQKAFGAYYTCPEITDYLCERTIYAYILQRLNASHASPHFEAWTDLASNLDACLCKELLHLLPQIRILDPACGSGAFLVSALTTLVNIYSCIAGKIRALHDPDLAHWLANAEAPGVNFKYFISKKIMTENLFGVDLMEEAAEIVAAAGKVEQLEPLPNLDLNILSGNSLIGFLHLDEEHVTQPGRFFPDIRGAITLKNSKIAACKSAIRHSAHLRTLSTALEQQRKADNALLNQVLLHEFIDLKIKYEETTWDAVRQAPGKTVRRDLRSEDIAALHPFHWGYEFAQIMEAGGFDIVITNPPWEALKPQAKEFFALHESTISKNKMRIEDFEREQSRLLQNDEMHEKWLQYQNAFPHQSAYFRAVPQYANQTSIVNGKKQGSDLNLYKLFVEQCYNLLRTGGLCGLVVPSGIYTDLGAKQLRAMLFDSTRITGLFGFENRKIIFEGVDSRFKFVVLTYCKGEQTDVFPAAFMRHEVSELSNFPQQGGQNISVELIRRLSPTSLSLVEFKNEMDLNIARKALLFPLLGERKPGHWNVFLTRELDMTNDHRHFKTEAGAGRLPLYEGKMIHQFLHTLKAPRYWVLQYPQTDRKDDENPVAPRAPAYGGYSSRKTPNMSSDFALGRKPDQGQTLEYQCYRPGYRSVGRSTDQRALIATILPPYTFAGNSLILARRFDAETGAELLQDDHILFLTALLNSFVLDYLVRQKISANLNMFYIYQLPVPRLTAQETVFRLIVQRAARLICTAPEFAGLWERIFPGPGWSQSVAANDPEERARLRAEIDGLVARLYNLNEEEFAYVLNTFPLVKQAVKEAAMQAYRDLTPVHADLRPRWP